MHEGTNVILSTMINATSKPASSSKNYDKYNVEMEI